MGKGLEIQPAVKKETVRIFITTLIGTIIMWLAVLVLHLIIPETVRFDVTVFLGGIGGMLVAVLNFFWMGITVQKVASTEDDKQARSIMKLSYSRRVLVQIAWIVIALVAEPIWWVTGILPLLFPSAGIKIKGIIDQIKFNRQEVDEKQDGC